MYTFGTSQNMISVSAALILPAGHTQSVRPAGPNIALRFHIKNAVLFYSLFRALLADLN